jgi:hypothetical protein
MLTLTKFLKSKMRDKISAKMPAKCLQNACKMPAKCLQNACKMPAKSP